jgi:hypothetical protein
MNIETLEVELLKEVEAIDSFLNKDEATWMEVRGALNMLKNKNRQHYHKLKRKLFMDFRMVDDHQITDPQLDPHMDKAYEIAGVLENKKF